MDSIHIQREFFASGATRSVEYRIRQLKSIYYIIRINEEEICAALKKDLGKSRFEAYSTEVGIVLTQIAYTLKHLRRWARPQRVPTSFLQFKGRGTVAPEPYGVCLILAPWNYPFQLSIAPAVAAIAAGNCVIIKPSEYAPATSEVISKIFNQNFEQRFCRVVTGKADVAKSLLMQRFDYIFFTGGTETGRQVMEQAARNLTPVTLELGGKSPCIVDDTAVIPMAARRIIWGKCLNAGQTCVAPDYVYVHRKAYQPLVESMKRWIVEFYGEKPEQNPEFCRIVNDRHFERLCGLLEGCEILAGGGINREERKLAPTLVAEPTAKHPIMGEEIFGPILPIIPYDDLEEVIRAIKERPSPLALYLFTRDIRTEKKVIRAIPFGGGCVNDTVLHLAGEAMPFGGIGESGMGSYHGKAGFDAFSHKKSILKSSSVLDIGLRYPPYGENQRKERVTRWITTRK